MTIAGKEGTVQFGANTPTQIKSFSIEENIDLRETFYMGQTWKGQSSGGRGWSAEVTCDWDPDDATGQGSVSPGDIAALDLAPEGNDTSGDVHYTGNGVLQSVSIRTDVNGDVERVYQFAGDGALTEATVA